MFTTTPTLNTRTHILELTRDREIPITYEQYKAIKIMQKIDKYNDPLEIRDPDSWQIIHDGLMRDIIWFREIERRSDWWDRYVCDFAVRHPIQDTCNCSNTYRMPPIVFRSKMIELYPWRYSSTLTVNEKNTVLKSIII